LVWREHEPVNITCRRDRRVLGATVDLLADKCE